MPHGIHGLGISYCNEMCNDEQDNFALFHPSLDMEKLKTNNITEWANQHQNAANLVLFLSFSWKSTNISFPHNNMLQIK